MKTKQTGVILALAITTETQQTVKWNIDTSHSKISFAVKHMMLTETTGQFKKYSGEVKTTGDDWSNASIDVIIDVNSIDTDDTKRDGHLKAEDFFYAEKYPEIRFTGKSFKKISGQKFELTGDLTMRGITKPINLDVVHNGTIKDPYGLTRSGFTVTGIISRKDFDLKWNALLEGGGLVVAEEVKINCAIELVKEK
jgi:polyisoprenoid-binding protein YceI